MRKTLTIAENMLRYSAVGINADIGALTGFYNKLLKEILKLSMIKPKLSCKIIEGVNMNFL